MRLLLIFTFVSTSALYAQSVSTRMGGRAAGLGYASACLRDEWGVLNNPAGGAQLKYLALSCAYDLRPALVGANRLAFAVASPLSTGTFAAGIFRFGDALYNEHVVTLGYSHQMGLAALGATVNYIQYHAENFGTKGVVTTNLGGIAELTPHLLVGAHIQNVNQPSLTETERVGTQLAAGICYMPSEKVYVLAEVQQALSYPTGYSMGLEYAALKDFTLRSGFSLNPSGLYCGWGFKKHKLCLEYAYQYLPTFLGSSHQASVGYRVIKK